MIPCWQDPNVIFPKRIFYFHLILLSACVFLAEAQTESRVVGRPVPVPAGAALPQWPRITPLTIEPGLPVVRSKDVEVIHAKATFGGFIVRVAGQAIAVGSVPLRSVT